MAETVQNAQVLLVCDDAGCATAYEVNAASVDAARTQLRQAGWWIEDGTFRRSRGAFCPEHAPRTKSPLRNESTPETRAIWANVDHVAARVPQSLRDRLQAPHKPSRPC
jgi:hypothetical protein